MSAPISKNTREFTNMNILKFIRAHEDPCVTASEIAAEFGVTNEAVNYRLNKLKRKGRVTDKTVGASAKIWYAKG